MTFAEVKNFYKQDNKEYDIKNNEEFIIWYDSLKKEGYCEFLDYDDIQELIDYIVTWYEIKYPERKLEQNEGYKIARFDNLEDISKVMDIEQLLFRLTDNQAFLLESGYRARGWWVREINKDGITIDRPQAAMYLELINDPESEYYFGVKKTIQLSADVATGEVYKDFSIEKYIEKEGKVYLDEVLSIFDEKYKDILDYTELKETIYLHKCDIELRSKILQLVALKLLYSRMTIPERGYLRAKKFIKEFNEKFNLSLSTEQIDKIFQRNYKEEEKNIEVEEIKHIKEEPKKNKSLVKRLFNKNI